MKELYIAIVDDDEDDVQLLKDCFKKYASIEIRDFPSGQAFLENHFGDALPCLLVIDLNLPDIRGIDLIDQVKANSLFSDLPIIVYTTAYTRREQISCDELKIRLVKKPDTILKWDEIALMMAHQCHESL
jgi:CheY-like chemotaxis protein